MYEEYRSPSKRLKRKDPHFHYIYVIRYRDTGEPIYVGMTTDPKRRMKDHINKTTLIDKDPDDYEMYRIAGGRRKTFAAEQQLTEHLLNQGHHLLNQQNGSKQMWRKRGFSVVDVIDAHTHEHVMSTVSQGDPYSSPGNMSVIYGLKKRHPQWLPKDADNYVLYLVADQLTRNEATLILVDHWGAIRRDNGKCNTVNKNILLPVNWPTEEEKKEQAKKREIKRLKTLCQQTDTFIVCTDTGDIFSSWIAAGSWARITDNNIRRAIKCKNGTAGGLHWKTVKRNELTKKQLSEVHLPPSLRIAMDLPLEYHIPITLAKWILPDQSETVDSNKINFNKIYTNKKCVCVINDLQIVTVTDTLIQAWTVITKNAGFKTNQQYIVEVHIIKKSYAYKYAQRMRRAQKGKL